MTKRPSVSQVVAVLELIARYFGWGIIFGRVNPPTALEIADLLDQFRSATDLGVRITGSAMIPEGDRAIILSETVTGIIDAIGGWEHLASVAGEIQAETPKDWWRVAEDYTTYIRPGGIIRSCTGRSMSARMFGVDGKHKINERTARCWFRRLLRMIAIHAISRPPEGAFDLIADTSGGAPR